jgi:hypothetical protein
MLVAHKWPAMLWLILCDFILMDAMNVMNGVEAVSGSGVPAGEDAGIRHFL